MRKRAFAAGLAILAGLAATAALEAQPRPGSRRPGNYANPSALIAAEIAFHRLAMEKGQWTAFRETADDAAVMFVPQAAMARAWLKGRANPPRTVNWQPHAVWMSCDGSLGATRGAWQKPDGSVGYFTTIWKRQEKGGYRWVLDQGDTLPAPLEAPELLAASVADCPDRSAAGRQGDGEDKPPRQVALPVPRVAPAEGGGASIDGTLWYSYKVAADNSRTVTVTMRRSGKDAIVVQSNVAAPTGD